MRTVCDEAKYLKAIDDDNMQMGLLNVYLNGYASKLGCNTSKNKGEIKIDFSTFRHIREAVAAKSLRPYHEEIAEKPEKVEIKKGYNYGGYVPKDA